MQFREYSVVGCLPLFKLERRFESFEEKGILNRVTKKHYSHFVTPYCNDNSNNVLWEHFNVLSSQCSFGFT